MRFKQAVSIEEFRGEKQRISIWWLVGGAMILVAAMLVGCNNPEIFEQTETAHLTFDASVSDGTSAQLIQTGANR